MLESVRAHESDSNLIAQLRKQLRGKINVFIFKWLVTFSSSFWYVLSDVSGVPRFACSSIINVTQIPTRHYVVFAVARVITAIFYEIPTEQLSEVLKNLFECVVKSNAIILNNTSMIFLPYFLMKSGFDLVDEKVFLEI